MREYKSVEIEIVKINSQDVLYASGGDDKEGLYGTDIFNFAE